MGDRKNFDKLKLDFEARIDTFRNRNTDIEDELRREIATLQKLIETLREQVTFERKRREVHDVNIASKTTTELAPALSPKAPTDSPTLWPACPSISKTPLSTCPSNSDGH